jgi:hypothetical protein
VPRLSAALFALITLLSAAAAAGETAGRIAVLQPDDELMRAISLSLSPWGVDAIESDEPPPPPLQPEAVQVASRLATELGVQAIVWISPAARGSLLSVFDARAGGITTRLVGETPPFDSAAAAAVALSVKTVLRSSVVAPPAERFGAQPPPPPPLPVEAPQEEHVLALEVGAGGTFVAENEAELELEVAAVAWVAAARRLGVSLELSFGPGLRVENELFQGHYQEIVLGGKAQFRFVHEPSVSAAVALGGALHFVRLQGEVVESSLERSVSRLNPSLDAELSVNVPIGSAAYLGASAEVGYLPTYQRYLVEGTPVFSPWPVAFGFGGQFGIELF